jgi:hypothetical protein
MMCYLPKQSLIFNVVHLYINMAANIDKVAEKAMEDMENSVRTSENREEAERKLDSRDVSYKIKDSTKEDEKQKYQPNRDIHA